MWPIAEYAVMHGWLGLGLGEELTFLELKGIPGPGDQPVDGT
jgi:hypothetical protein